MTARTWALCGLAVAALLDGGGCANPNQPGLSSFVAPEKSAAVPSSTSEKKTAAVDEKSEDKVKTANRKKPQPENLSAADIQRLQAAPAHAAEAEMRNAPRRVPQPLGKRNTPPPVKQPAEEEASIPEEPRKIEPEPLTLSEAIELTFQANPELHSALERTQIAEALLDNARAQFYPILAANMNYQVSDNPLRKFTYLLYQGVADPNRLFPLRGVEDLFQSQLHFQHDLITGGLRVANARAARAERDGAEHSLAAVHNKLVYQVAEAYYRVFQARALVGVRKETVTQVESQLKAVKSRFEAKTVVRSDVLKVELRLAEVREASSMANNALQLAWAVLENIVGARLEGRELPEILPPAPWAEHLDSVEKAIAVVNDPKEIEGVVSEALEKRPELGELLSQIEAAEHRVMAAHSAKCPTLGVVGDLDHYIGTQSNQGSYFVGLAFSLNLFDGHRTKSNVRRAEALVREIAARHRRAILDIELDVRRSYLQLKDSRERLTSTQSAKSNAEENLRLVESRFREQAATTTELLDAQVLLSDVRVRSTSAAADVEIARSSLERAIGRLTTLDVFPENGHP